MTRPGSGVAMGVRVGVPAWRRNGSPGTGSTSPMGVPGVRVPWESREYESREWEYESHGSPGSGSLSPMGVPGERVPRWDESHGVSGLSHGEIFLSEESAASRDPGVLREE